MENAFSALWVRLAFAVGVPLAFNLLYEICRGTKFSSPGEIIRNALPGDILEFKRFAYSHFALYLGDGYVMDIISGSGIGAKICQKRLKDVCGNSKVRIRNMDKEAHAMHRLKALDRNTIIENARSYENQIVSYEMLDKNCEYYCTLWRYRKGFSLQANNPVINTTAGRTLTTIAATSLLLETANVVSNNRKRRREEEENETTSKRAKLTM